MQALRCTRRAPGLGLHSRGFLTAAAYKLAQKQMPKMSETEKVALGCGTVGFDRDIFTGSPSLKHLLDTYNPKLSAEEQAFLDNETVELCKLLDDHKVTANKDFTAEAWDYMRDKGFFGMKIPKEWGGLGFSTMCVSSVLAKLGSHCFDANATVAVPNSLGPGELLVRYGTSAQQAYFLPRLADGTLIPCFGLTGPQSGSDATSLIGSYGVVEKRGDELGVRATFDKRYITLAPVAGVVGLGFELPVTLCIQPVTLCIQPVTLCIQPVTLCIQVSSGSASSCVTPRVCWAARAVATKDSRWLCSRGATPVWTWGRGTSP